MLPAAEIDHPVGEDEALDPDHLVVAVEPGAALVHDVQIAGAGEEGIFLDQPGIISDVEAVIAVDQVVAVAAEEMLVAILAVELVVAGAAIERIATIAAVDDIVAAEAVDDVRAVAAVDQVIAAGADMRRHVEFLPLFDDQAQRTHSRDIKLIRNCMMLARPLPISSRSVQTDGLKSGTTRDRSLTSSRSDSSPRRCPRRPE